MQKWSGNFQDQFSLVVIWKDTATAIRRGVIVRGTKCYFHFNFQYYWKLIQMGQFFEVIWIKNWKIRKNNQFLIFKSKLKIENWTPKPWKKSEIPL